MFNINSLIIIVSLFSAPQHIITNKFAEAISYDSFSIKEPNFKDTMNYNTISSEEFVKKNNEKLLLDIIKQEQMRQ